MKNFILKQSVKISDLTVEYSAIKRMFYQETNQKRDFTLNIGQAEFIKVFSFPEKEKFK